VIILGLKDVKWTPKKEAMLESLLLDYGFCFIQSAKEFNRLCNRDDGTNQTEFRIDPKELQIKWTEIEMRRQGAAK
jgi:hypothetical protein